MISEQFMIYLFIALVIGALLSYFWLRILMVKRSLFYETQKELDHSIFEKKTLKEKSDQLDKALKDLEMNLSSEKEINKNQAKEITRLETIVDHIKSRFLDEQQINRKQQEDIEHLNNQLHDLEKARLKLEEQNKSLAEKLQKQYEDFEVSRKKSLTEFENIANRLFEEKTNKFSVQSKENIEQLLNPLRENLKDFKKQVEETYEKESKQRFSLEDRIKELVTLNQQISKEANNLTNALKGQVKTQGDWGEMILENILEYSGLTKGREYFVQESFRDENGNLKQPDITVKYPGDRYIIIDSKVSLSAYERYVNAENPEKQKLYLAQHIKSIQNHVDNLSAKEYEHFAKALDYVFLFIPIEPAFLLAIQENPELWNYAYKKRVLLISPTNLIAALKMISDIWQREHQNANALEIAKRGGLLYDKFVGFVNDLEDIDKHLSRAKDKYGDAMNKLSYGKGNLMRQAEELKTLGVSAKKELPDQYLN